VRAPTRQCVGLAIPYLEDDSGPEASEDTSP
jgi:hypothetical protein